MPAGPDGKARSLFVELKPAPDGQSYDVNSAGPFRANYPGGGGRSLLWSEARANSPDPNAGDPAAFTTPLQNETGSAEASASAQSNTADMGAGAEAVKDFAPAAPGPLHEAAALGDAKADPVSIDDNVEALARAVWNGFTRCPCFLRRKALRARALSLILPPKARQAVTDQGTP